MLVISRAVWVRGKEAHVFALSLFGKNLEKNEFL